MNTNKPLRIVVGGLLASSAWLSGCATPCEDDGLIQDNQDCPAITGGDTDGSSSDGTGNPMASTGEDADGDGTTTGDGGGTMSAGSGDSSSGTAADDTAGTMELTATAGSETSGDTCDNGEQDGDETDVDCGGSCDGCEDGGGCTEGGDCESGVCDPDTMTCTPPACDDGVQNGDETRVDCGGGTCDACDDGRSCNDGSDCVSGVCDPDTMTCTAPTCDDGVQNGDETDIDCGGDTCDACGDGGLCLDASDCTSGVCDPNTLTCTPPACDDGVQNGDETDVDCGGGTCDACDPGEGCIMDSDCTSAGCDGGTMTCNELLSVTGSPSCSEYDGANAVPLSAAAMGGTGGPYTYAWTPDDGSLSTPDMAMTDATPTGFQSYTVTADDGAAQATDTVVVVNTAAFDLENNCTLFTDTIGGEASISYDMGGTRACELGNNGFGLHLCDVEFEDTRLNARMEVTDADGDDDWIGVVWGAADSSNFYSLVWKAAEQDLTASPTFGCVTPAGMLVKRVEAPDFDALTGTDVYCPQDTPQSAVLLDPSETTTAGWEEGEAYDIQIDYTATGSTVTITRESDATEIANFAVDDTTFTSGLFGSTTFSQANACVGPLQAECL